MNTGKLKVSHLRGATAIKACAKISQVLTDAITTFYNDHITNIVAAGGDAHLLPSIYMHNQADLTSFLKPWRDGKKTSGWVYSSTPVEQLPYPKLNDFILLFNDTLRIEFEWTAEKYDYKYVPMASSWIHVSIHAVCLDRQKFLDALDIEPEIDIPQYVDILGNPVSVGDVICTTFGNTNRLYLDKVKKFTPYSIVLESGYSITHKSCYDNKLVVVSGLPMKLKNNPQ